MEWKPAKSISLVKTWGTASSGLPEAGPWSGSRRAQLAVCAQVPGLPISHLPASSAPPTSLSGEQLQVLSSLSGLCGASLISLRGAWNSPGSTLSLRRPISLHPRYSSKPGHPAFGRRCRDAPRGRDAPRQPCARSAAAEFPGKSSRTPTWPTPWRIRSRGGHPRECGKLGSSTPCVRTQGPVSCDCAPALEVR